MSNTIIIWSIIAAMVLLNDVAFGLLHKERLRKDSIWYYVPGGSIYKWIKFKKWKSQRMI